jgi:hypothetical protein
MSAWSVGPVEVFERWNINARTIFCMLEVLYVAGKEFWLQGTTRCDDFAYMAKVDSTCFVFTEDTARKAESVCSSLQRMSSYCTE